MPRGIPKPKRYVPNSVPAIRRWVQASISFSLMSYGVYGLWIDDISMPTKRGMLHFHGFEAIILFLCIVCFAAHFFAIVVDHFDKRDNEIRYRSFENWIAFVGWCFGLISIIVLMVKHAYS
jgi:hypothetical protein